MLTEKLKAALALLKSGQGPASSIDHAREIVGSANALIDLARLEMQAGADTPPIRKEMP